MEKITRVDSDSSYGIYVFITASESVYELTVDNTKTLKRIPKEGEAHKLRRDFEKLRIIGDFFVEVNRSAFFELEPLGDGEVTTRITTTVISIASKGVD